MLYNFTKSPYLRAKIVFFFQKEGQDQDKQYFKAKPNFSRENNRSHNSSGQHLEFGI